MSDAPHTYQMTSTMREDPFQVNAEGTAWWIDRDLTRYAQQSLGDLPALPDVTVLVAENLTGAVDRIVLEAGKPVYHSTGLETVACWIDGLRLSRSHQGSPAT